MKRTIFTLTAITVLSTIGQADTAQAQLVFANDQFDQPQYMIDVEHDRSFQLLSPRLYGGPGAWGMAADNDLGVIYYNNAQYLYKVSATTLRPEYLGTIQVDNEDAPMDGLAWDSDSQIMYGITSYPESGLYQIDLTTFEATFVMPIDPLNNAGGLDYDNGTHSLLALFDGARALFRIDPIEQTTTLITAYPTPPPYVDDIDGLATGDGKAYFICDRQEPIFIYDLKAGKYLEPLTSPIFGVGTVAGATWAPSFTNRLLVSEPIPGRVGRNNRFHILGAEPLSTVYLLFGMQLGNVRVPGCSGTFVQIASPRIIGSTTSDTDGAGQIGVYVPVQAYGLPTIFQIVDPAHCHVGNLTFFEFGPE